ncbi:endoplasmic reticulum metallopeptidase 1 [Teleopsis dalmanni]|uniref:endoplasmic reticulum metallopeptidase 1 n=1 Tax=Teleopsis dalmanni TaxID=139649 RepID=UPI0018CD7D9D|nr:endoplasmic reticulum metallopeptidase 1 [Teleopsis dalmanni]XP_037954987.1 endoplasmic reticulum metallopeptidase 1 [Teleopsis dalmanni]XP_037954988.1 endoplasmic reticulum metallopeptidase 1 [Teleopsis dalmanni]
MNSKYEKMKITYSRSKVGWYWSPLFVAFWFLLFYLVAIPSFNRFPENLKLEDESKYPGRFIGERAESTLLKLSKIGPKIVGSPANEQGAIQFLLNEIDKIIYESRSDLYNIEQDVQIATGNYVLWKMVNSYQSIQNVVVKLTPINNNSTACLLINSHYDSVPGSSGAGDAGMMIVIMLEVLRVLSKYDTPLSHPIVFLFNGAEENPLQGSHAFITQHKWAENVRAVINLDSAGSGGREILFQSGPDHPWLMKYYGANIMHPYASTIGEELFQNGFIPSETDFRIFRDFGNIPGLDMAHTFNGYVYHTKFDRFNLIPRNTYQLTGDNVLALTKALANAPELEDPAKYAEGHTIFYDMLGWFMIYYSETTGVIINIVVCVIAIATILVYIWNMAHQTGMFRRRIFIKFGILFGIQLAAVVLAFLLTMTITVFLDAVGLSMSWFSQSWIIFGLYFCPMFFVMGIIPAIYLSRIKEHGLPIGYAIQLLMHAHCLILTVLTIIMISLGIRSTFIIMFCIGFYTLSVILNMLTCFHNKTFLWLIPHTICQLLPYMFYTYICYAFFLTFIPMQGRDGANTNPELLMGGFTAIMCLLFAPFIIPLFCLFRKSKTIISIFGGICIIFIILAATPVGFPYVEKEAPQRFYAVHTTRTFHNGDSEMSVRRSDSGFYVVPVDRRPHSIDEMFDNTNLTKSNKADCDRELMCGYPIYSSRWLGWKEQSFWIPGPEPNKEGWPTLKILSKERSSSTNILYTLEISGPDHMSLFINPVEDAKLVDWSFDKEPIEKGFSKPYFVYFSYALDPTPLRFILEFERGSPDWSGYSFDIAIIGHKVHHDIYNTDEFREFLARFPKWAHVSAWTSSYESWTL